MGNGQVCREESQDMDGRSGKPATWQQVLIINDLSGNKIGNKPATEQQHFSFWSRSG
jgi:hypothetical protein